MSFKGQKEKLCPLKDKRTKKDTLTVLYMVMIGKRATRFDAVQLKEYPVLTYSIDTISRWGGVD